MAPGDGSVVTLDTNVAVYAFSDVDAKADRAIDVLRRANFLSVQLLNEFLNVMWRKRGLSLDRVEVMLDQLVASVDRILPLDADIHREGRRIAGRYRLPVYDALMVAAALRGGATQFYTEDLHDGLIVDDRLAIRNPFREAA